MQKFGQEKLSDFMKNLGPHVQEINARCLSLNFQLRNEKVQGLQKERKESLDEKSQAEMKFQQKNSVSGSIKQDQDSQLIKCRLELEEIQRQQKEKYRQQCMTLDKNTQSINEEINEKYKNQLGQNYDLRDDKTENKDENHSKSYQKPSSHMIENINDTPVQHYLPEDSHPNQFQNSNQNFSVKAQIYQQEYQKNGQRFDEQSLKAMQKAINEQISTDFKDQQQIQPTFFSNFTQQERHVQSAQSSFNEENYKIVTQNEKITTEEDITPHTLNSSLQNKKQFQQPTIESLSPIQSYQMQQQQTLKISGPKLVQQLRQDLVHKITDNLQVIFELFKQKIPQKDQIDIIRQLYVKYIGPQQQSNAQKSSKEKQKQYSTNIQGALDFSLQNDYNNSQSFGTIMSQRIQPQNRQMKPVMPLKGHQEKITISQPDIRNIISHLKFPPPVQDFKRQEKIEPLVPKRPYTKRGGENNQRYLDEQNVARLFVKKGYGLHVARKYLGENIENNQYTNLITTIIRQAWRKIQDYVSRLQQIKPMDTSQYKVIKTSLVQCAKWMDSTDLETFYGFLKLAYDLDKKQPYEDEAMRLYRTCLNKYNELRGQYENQTKMKLEKKFVQNIGNKSLGYSMRNSFVKNTPVNKDKKLAKSGPSEHQLGDLINMIKSQLKQNNNTVSTHIPPMPYQQKPQMPNNPQMMRLLPQNMNYPRFSQNHLNGQRR